MATETVASDHTSTTDEQLEKKVNEEAIEQKSVCLPNENEGKHDKAEDAQGLATPSSKTEGEAEGDEKKAELAAVEVEKPDDSAAFEASAEDNLRHDKVEDAQGPTAHLSKTEEEDEGDEKKSEPAVVVEEKIDGSPSSGASVADTLKEEKELISDSRTINVTEQAPDAAKGQPEEPPPREPTEYTETEEEKQPKTADIPETSAETVGKSSYTAEANPLIESEAEVVKETENLEISSHKAEKPEPVVTEVQEKSQEPEKESQDQEAEQPNTVAIPDPSAENNEKPSDDAIEEKTREPEFDAEVLKETNNYEAGPTETEKAEPVATETEENPSEPEKQSFEKEEEELRKTFIHEKETDSAEQPIDIVEVHPPQESDIEVVRESGNSKSEAVPVKAEKPELVSTEVEERPREQLEVDEEVGKTSKNAETEQEFVRETAKSKGTSDDTVKEPISLTEEKTNKEEESSIPGSSARASLNEEAQPAPANLVESYPAIGEKAVEDGKKESSCTNEIQGVLEEVVGVLKNPDQASINLEAKTDLKEEREYSAPTSVEEKAAANDDKKQPGAPDAVEGSSREAEVEIKKVEEQNEAKTATTEAGGVKVESVKGDKPEVDNKKERHPESKVDELVAAASEHVRETLASKLEEKEEFIKTGVDNLEKVQIEDPVKTDVQIPEPPRKESDATKTSKDLPKETPAKPALRQSNNIISKVKQSLVKVKKAIIGKSPSSKGLSSEAKAKGDIKVK